jgi:ketosteroid isomerase-like protein
MAGGDAVRQEDAVLAARRFLDAFNERDVEAMRALVTDDAELSITDGRSWTGADGAEELLDAARELDLRLIPLQRGEHAEERDGVVYVELRVRELIRFDDVERIADFVVRDGHVASFALRPIP